MKIYEIGFKSNNDCKDTMDKVAVTIQAYMLNAFKENVQVEVSVREVEE